jgi:hypothetical protein
VGERDSRLFHLLIQDAGSSTVPASNAPTPTPLVEPSSARLYGSLLSLDTRLDLDSNFVENGEVGDWVGK